MAQTEKHLHWRLSPMTYSQTKVCARSCSTVGFLSPVYNIMLPSTRSPNPCLLSHILTLSLFLSITHTHTCTHAPSRPVELAAEAERQELLWQHARKEAKKQHMQTVAEYETKVKVSGWVQRWMGGWLNERIACRRSSGPGR